MWLFRSKSEKLKQRKKDRRAFLKTLTADDLFYKILYLKSGQLVIGQVYSDQKTGKTKFFGNEFFCEHPVLMNRTTINYPVPASTFGGNPKAAVNTLISTDFMTLSEMIPYSYYQFHRFFRRDIQFVRFPTNKIIDSYEEFLLKKAEQYAELERQELAPQPPEPDDLQTPPMLEGDEWKQGSSNSSEDDQPNYRNRFNFDN